MEELKRICSQGNFKLFIMMWDMNTLVNPYFKRLLSSRKVTNIPRFIEDKITELKNILLSHGFRKDQFFLYKSSDLWRRLVSYRDDNLFQQFYSVIAQMQNKDFVEHKTSHLIQYPMSLFFCTYLHKLCPEDTDKPMDLLFFGPQREKIYTMARATMYKEGIIENEKPFFIVMKDYPYITYNEALPNWEHGRDYIREMLTYWNLTKPEILSIMCHLKETIVKMKIKESEFDYDNFVKNPPQYQNEKLIEILATAMHIYLQERKKTFLELDSNIDETVLNISNKEEIKKMGEIMRSKIALQIMFFADGTRNITQMAKDLKKSVATISIYASKLKKMNLIRVIKNDKIKRNVKGLKVNFEFS